MSNRVVLEEGGTQSVSYTHLDVYKRQLLAIASVSDSASGMKKRKTMKKSTYNELDSAIAEWLAQVRSEGTPVSVLPLQLKQTSFLIC